MEKKILGIGNALVDILIKLPNDELLNKLSLAKGSMQLVDENRNQIVMGGIRDTEKQIVAGGSACNTICGIASLGMSSDYIGIVGDDKTGEIFKQELINNGVTPHLFYSATETGTATTFISPDSERTFATYLGAAIELNEGLLSKELFKGYEYFHIEGYLLQNHELIERAVMLAKSQKLKVSLDLASYNVVEENLDFLKAIIEKYVDIVFANEEEAKAFTGLEAEEALYEIAKVCEIAIVKIGKNGSLVKQNEEIYQIGTLNTQPIDTTGAGDLYAAGFLYGLVNHYPLLICGEIGKILSGNVIEVIGPKMDKNRWQNIKNEIDKLVKQ